MLKWVKRFFKGCLWSILGIFILIAGFILLVIITTPSIDKKKEAEINRLYEIGHEKVPELLKFLDDKDGAIRYEVIYKLNDFRDRRTLNPLIKELKTSNYEVSRKWAAQALGNLGDTSAVLPLIQALYDSSFHVRYKSADALGKIGDERALAPLIILAENDEMEYVSIYAENAIIDICDKSGLTMPKIKRRRENVPVFKKFMNRVKNLFSP
ncbi:HEAT repeat domain-containing protein [Candidatus Desantisbacteria bacterium]|nr:HEAT repeat domain-containing protein [Candidatus Desantisbacteria bacterium]